MYQIVTERLVSKDLVFEQQMLWVKNVLDVNLHTSKIFVTFSWSPLTQRVMINKYKNKLYEFFQVAATNLPP